MKRYAANDFSDRRRPTIGADFMTKEIIAGDQPMLLQVSPDRAESPPRRISLNARMTTLKGQYFTSQDVMPS